MIYGLIEGGNKAVIYNAKKKLGPFRARAMQAMSDLPGESAIYEMDLTGNDVGLYRVDINVNDWDVYGLDSPDLTTLLLDFVVPQGY